ncbi:MAG: cysteine desulfurase-like protein, partial [Acidimicrobiia bacterium]|nr:cysteine desulfurase-like protein [Acidimicrobiia bacterium]
MVGDKPAVYLDGPGGTQVPESVIAAMTGYLAKGGSNLGGPFPSSVASGQTVGDARAAMADLFGCSPGEVMFGQNMTSLTFALSRAIARTWEEGDNIVVTRLDHDANISPWVRAASDRGVDVHWIDFDPDDGCRLDWSSAERAIDDQTRLVAVTRASNAVGTEVDVVRMSAAAHSVGALVFVDGVHATPHVSVDVAAWDVDFYAASAYKFFGPHTGIVYGKGDLLASLDAYKVRPAPSDPPGKWETGTQSFESLAGVTAAVDHIAGLGEGATRRARLVDAMSRVHTHEAALSQRFLDGIASLEKVALYGVDSAEGRAPTFAVSVGAAPARMIAEDLGKEGIFVWAGHYYAVEVMSRLGWLDKGGLIRIGFCHYNTIDEVDRLLNALNRLG